MTSKMTARLGYHLKIPFVWEAGCPLPRQSGRLHFHPATKEWLSEAVAAVLATSLDPADQLAVTESGPHGAAAELLALSSSHSKQLPEWWQLAQTEAGQPIGFVLCSTFMPNAIGQCDGTIFYMGVLPHHRGNGYSRELLDHATRTLCQIGVERIRCDTAISNAPMIAAFRRAGYGEREPWERPLR